MDSVMYNDFWNNVYIIVTTLKERLSQEEI